MVRRQLRHLSLPCRILMAERLEAGRLEARRLLAGDLSTQATRWETLDGVRAGPGSITSRSTRRSACPPSLALHCKTSVTRVQLTARMAHGQAALSTTQMDEGELLIHSVTFLTCIPVFSRHEHSPDAAR